MVGERLGVDLHVVSAEAAAARNLMLAVERCHLGIEAVVATPYAAGLSALVDDEAEMGVAVIDMGGGTTSVGVFAGGQLVHADAIAVGGHHVTMDIARGLTTRVAAAERLKTLYGSCDRDELGRPRHDRRATRSTRTSATSRTTCRSRSSCASSSRASRRSSSSSATASRTRASPRRPAAASC